MRKVLLFSLIVSINALLLNAKPNPINSNNSNNNFNQIVTIFKKKLRRKCRYTSACLAQKHTQQEWGNINKNGLFKEEFLKLCPKGVGILDDKMIESLFYFTYEYARGTQKHLR